MINKRFVSAQDFKSSFLSVEKDFNEILMRLFVNGEPYSKDLIKLLVINTKDCLDDGENQKYYNETIKDMSLAKLKELGYVKLVPKIAMPDHEEVKSYIIMSMDNFSLTSNPEFRDCTITFDILCHNDYWDLGGCRLRPLKIAGYIDGLLNKARLSGIGRLEFVSCKELLLDEILAGYTLMYRAVHGKDDLIES